jgi:hypothetical protein
MNLFGGSRFNHLKSVAKEKQEQTFNPDTGEYESGNNHFDEATKKIVSGKVKLTEAQAKEATINYVLSEGLDYKGQFQCFYDSKGLKTELSASVDPAQMFTGFVNTVITVGAGVEVAKQVMVTAHRGPMEVSDSQGGPVWKIQTPIQIGCLPGVHWKGTLSAGIEVSVGVSYSVGSDGEGESSVPNSEPEDSEAEMEIEGIGLGFEAEAKAGIEASVGYTYDHFYAEDVCPLPSPSNEKARENLRNIIESGSAKAAQKRMAVDFINTNSVYFSGKKVNYNRSFTHLHHTSSDELIDVLKLGISNQQFPKEKRAESLSYMNSLAYWSSHPKRKKVETHVYISSHEGLANADVFASASAGVTGGIVGVQAEAKAKFLEVKGSRKKANIKYQVCFDAMNQHNVESQVVMTQETQIQYSTFDFIPFDFEVSAEANALGMFTAEANAHINHAGAEVSAGVGYVAGSQELSKEKEFKHKNSLSMNRMSYVAATVFWEPSASLTGPNKKSSVKTLSGTGISFGGSFLLSNILGFYRGYSFDDKQFDNKSIKKYFARISRNLNIALDKLVEFMLNSDTRSLLYDLENKGNNVDVILLEVGYRIKQSNILVQHNENSVVSIVPGEIKKIIENSSDQNMQLESIRIRFRMQDTYEHEGNLFGLGIKVGNTGGGIKLKYVHDAGSEGIVDLHTVWMDPDLIPDYIGLANILEVDQTETYEKAVPPVTLFCQ